MSSSLPTVGARGMSSLSQLGALAFGRLARLLREPLGLDLGAEEYERLNAAVAGLTAIRSFLESLSVRIPFESPVERDARGLPVGGGMPRPLYLEAFAAVVEAEHAVMRIRDRNGWSDAYDKYGHQEYDEDVTVSLTGQQVSILADLLLKTLRVLNHQTDENGAFYNLGAISIKDVENIYSVLHPSGVIRHDS